MFFYVILKDLVKKNLCNFSFLVFTYLDPDRSGSGSGSGSIRIWIRIRIYMDMIGILDPDPHENLCGSETLYPSSPYVTSASS